VLIFNFLNSFSEDEDNVDEEEGVSANGLDTLEVHEESSTWLDEYQLGCDWEIYSTPIGEVFLGNKFSDLAVKLYMKLGIVLMGLRLNHRSGKHPPKILLNPGSFRLPRDDQYDIEGYVIAKNKEDSDLSMIVQAGQGRSGTGDVRISKLTLVASQLSSMGGMTDIHRGIVFGSRTNHDTGGYGSSYMRTKEGGSAILQSITQMPNILLTGKITSGPIQSITQKALQAHGLNDREADWKSFLQKELRREARSQQEISQAERDNFFRQKYYVREKENNSCDLEDCTIPGFVSTEIPNVDNLIIIAARELKYLYNLILPLRNKSSGPCRYIVILTPFDIPDHVWRDLNIFEGILVVRGSSLEEKDLRRAGIYRCNQLVVLADTTHHGTKKSSRSGNEGLIDVDAIFTYQLVKRMNPKTNVILEMVR